MTFLCPLVLFSAVIVIVWNAVANFLAFWKRYNEMVQISNKIPGLPRHWFFGNTLQMKSFHDFVVYMQKKFIDKGERMYYLWIFFFRPSLIVAHPDNAKNILRTGEPKPRGKMDGYTFMKPWLGEGLLIANGPKWERSRRLLTPAFHFDVLGPYFKIYNEVSDTFLNKLWNASRFGPVEVFKPAGLATLDTLLRCSLSYKGNIQTLEESHPYVVAVNSLEHLVMKRALNLFHYPEWIYKFSSDGKEFFRLCDFVHEFSHKIIIQRRKDLIDNPGNRNKKYLDFLDILLTAKDSDGKGLSDEEIQCEVDTFMFAGHDTTACVLSWSIYCLAKYPEIQEKVHEEVQQVLGEKLYVEKDDLPKFTYLPCFLKEVMRMYPPVPLITRKTTQTHIVDGIEIPVGTYVSISIHHIHHHPDVWEDPWVFKPERFLENSAKDPYSFIPFSAGPRNCIGQNFAMNEEKVFVSRLVKRFEVMVDPNHTPQPFMEVVTRSSNGIQVILREREKPDH